MLETNPIERLTKKQKLMAYKHKGFWQCMDTERDKNFLKKLIKNKKLTGCNMKFGKIKDVKVIKLKK